MFCPLFLCLAYCMWNILAFIKEVGLWRIELNHSFSYYYVFYDFVCVKYFLSKKPLLLLVCISFIVLHLCLTLRDTAGKALWVGVLCVKPDSSK